MTKNWKKFSQRGLSLLVCLVMCLGMLPGVAWAAEEHSRSSDCAMCASGQHDADWDIATNCRYCTCCGAVYWALVGWTTDKGTFCGLNDKNHTWDTVSYQAPTCTAAGHEVGRTCRICGKVEGQASIPATDHAYTYTDNKDGTHKYSCLNCEDFSDNVEHTYDQEGGSECICGAKRLLVPTLV